MITNEIEPTTFLEFVTRSGLIEPRTLEEYVERLRKQGEWPDDPLAQARRMLAQGKLTKYQAEQLLRGKWRNFEIGGKYTVMERLSNGPMSSVFLCEHVVMKRMVTLKFLPDQSGEPSLLARFHREARAAARLQHPNVVGIYDVDRVGKLHFLVSEYIDGNNLAQVVKLTGPMPAARAAHYISQAAEGLQHAHEMGMIHRDIKPSNFLLDRSGTVKLLDLGLARLLQDETDGMTQLADGRMMLGTIDYLAPEQAVDSHDVDIRADIYGLGATFFFLLTGRTLYEGASSAQKLAMHSGRSAKLSVGEVPGVSKALSKVLQKMLAKDRAHRHQTPAEVVEALAPFVREPVDPPSEEEMPRLCVATRRAVEQTRSTMLKIPSKGTAASRPPSTSTSHASLILPRLQAGAKASSSRIRVGLARTSPKAWIGLGAGITALASAITVAWALGGGARDAQSSPLPTAETRAATHAIPSKAEESAESAYSRATGKLHSHEEQEAATILRRLFASNPGFMGSYGVAQLAVLDLYLGNLDEHRRDCSEMMDRYGRSGDPNDIERILKNCLLSREPVLPAKTRELAKALAEPAGRDTPDACWYKAVLGLSAIRSGELDRAMSTLDEARERVDPDASAARCIIEMLRSIALARRGDVEKARASLASGISIFEKSTSGGSNFLARGSWHDWYVCAILRREAESLLRKSPG